MTLESSDIPLPALTLTLTYGGKIINLPEENPGLYQ
jgi:hypothetical protein